MIRDSAPAVTPELLALGPGPRVRDFFFSPHTKRFAPAPSLISSKRLIVSLPRLEQPLEQRLEQERGDPAGPGLLGQPGVGGGEEVEETEAPWLGGLFGSSAGPRASCSFDPLAALVLIDIVPIAAGSPVAGSLSVPALRATYGPEWLGGITPPRTYPDL